MWNENVLWLHRQGKIDWANLSLIVITNCLLTSESPQGCNQDLGRGDVLLQMRAQGLCRGLLSRPSNLRVQTSRDVLFGDRSPGSWNRCLTDGQRAEGHSRFKVHRPQLRRPHRPGHGAHSLLHGLEETRQPQSQGDTVRRRLRPGRTRKLPGRVWQSARKSHRCRKPWILVWHFTK